MDKWRSVQKPKIQEGGLFRPRRGRFSHGAFFQKLWKTFEKILHIRTPVEQAYFLFCLTQILEERRSRIQIWGFKTEQLSDFSTIRAGYPRFLGSYPHFLLMEADPQHHIWGYKPWSEAIFSRISSTESRKWSSPSSLWTKDSSASPSASQALCQAAIRAGGRTDTDNVQV